MLLAGDVNGTRTDLAIFSVEGGPHAPLTQAKVHSADYPSDVAGPLSNGHVKVTNLPPEIDELSLARDRQFECVHLLNDVEAVARAIPILRPKDLLEPLPAIQKREELTRLHENAQANRISG